MGMMGKQMEAGVEDFENVNVQQMRDQLGDFQYDDMAFE